MLHRNLNDMLDEMLNDPGQMIISSNSRTCALLVLPDDTTMLVQGDFSGSRAQCEAEARRILRGMRINTNRRGAYR